MDMNHTHRIPIDINGAIRHFTLQYVDCWPSGRLQLQPVVTDEADMDCTDHNTDGNAKVTTGTGVHPSIPIMVVNHVGWLRVHRRRTMNEFAIRLTLETQYAVMKAYVYSWSASIEYFVVYIILFYKAAPNSIFANCS